MTETKDDISERLLARARVIDRPQVTKLLGVSSATFARMVRDGGFLRPIQLSPRRIGWRIGDVLDWLEARAKAE